jgi:hypothetical protein
METTAKTTMSIVPSAAVWRLCAIAVLSFVVGVLLTVRLMRLQQVRADSSRVFELMIYHTKPGKEPELESGFRDVSKLQTKHNLNVVGYWVPNEDPAWKDTFVYLLVHPSRKDADANWQALHTDPAFLPYRKAAEPLIEKVDGDFQVDEIYMRATDFSAIK